MHRQAEALRSWLQTNPTADELRDAFPDEWAEVHGAIAAAVERGDHDELRRMAFAAAEPPSSTRGRARSHAEQRTLVVDQIRRHLAADALARLRLSMATGVTEGSTRFNRIEGRVLQWLLFERDLVRKPVSLRRFRLLWPLLRQRRLLMPLVTPKGISCFYSRELIAELAALIGTRPCLEIAAGDGTLSRFLSEAGVDIIATDDHSWSDRVMAGPDVQRQDARAALRVHQPSVVLCSWPPADNDFERDVFSTSSVQLYLVISSRHEYASGDWKAYRRQRAFEQYVDERLSALVLPPDLDPAVHVFQRRATPKR